MKRALLILTTLLGAAVTSMAQVTSIEVETYYTDDGTVTGYPAGHTTYRIYANTTNATDRVTTVSGNDFAPMILNVTGSGIWNHPNGGSLGDDVLCSLYALFPILEYDSYATIGYTCDNDGGGVTAYELQDVAQPWNQVFTQTPYSTENILVNTVVGGTWFVTTDNVNSIAGADQKVLLAQITTDGQICGIFNLQVFPEYSGPGSDYILQTGLEFGTEECGTPGCIDELALNFDPEADFDNGLCIYPCTIDFDNVIVQSPLCAGDENGYIFFDATGAQSFVEYSFNGDEIGLNADTIMDLGNGTYTITVHDTRFDNPALNPGGIYGECSATQEITLNTTAIFLNASSITEISCNNANDACVSTDASDFGGGTGTLSFMILTNSNDTVQDGSGENVVLDTPDYCGLGGGTYHFVAMDENGCTINGPSFTIVNPAALTLFEGGEGAASCFNSPDAQQVITWGGGTGDVDFSLENDSIYDIEGNPSNALITDLLPGSHTIYAIDENDCTAELTFTVAGGPAITVNPNVVSPSCNGDTNGAIAIMAGGGTGTLEYSFDGVDYSSDATLENIGAGTYNIWVQDANGCIATQEVVVTEPGVLTATAIVNNVSCAGQVNGSIEVITTGGTDIFAFSLDSVNWSPSPLFTGLPAGTYEVFVSDANNCTTEVNNLVIIEDPLTADAVVSNISCFGENNGQILVNIEGGAAPFQFDTGSGSSPLNPIINLTPGTYTVTVSDSLGCVVVIEDVVVVEPSELEITGLSANPIDSDPGGNTPYTVTGGTGDYTYEWTLNGNTVSSTEDLPALTEASDAGTYILTVTDENGCEVSSTIVVTGIGELGQEYFITLYPNPTNGQFVINISGMKGEKMSYDVLDAAGRVVYAKELGNVNGTRIESVDITDAAAGIYNIQFNIGSDVHSMRVIKN